MNTVRGGAGSGQGSKKNHVEMSALMRHITRYYCESVGAWGRGRGQ